MAIKAYILVVTDPLQTKRVVASLQAVDGVTAVNEVMGPYDMVVELTVDDLQQVPQILSNHIRQVDGVESTTSLVVFPDSV